MPAPRVRATMFTRQGRRTDPHGHSHSVELHEAASPYRHPRYDGPSAKEKLIPMGPSAASGRLLTDWPLLPVLTHSRRWRQPPVNSNIKVKFCETCQEDTLVTVLRRASPVYKAATIGISPHFRAT